MAKKVLNLKFKTVYNGIDLNEFYPGSNDSKQIRLLSVGRLIERKGVDYIIIALNEVLNKYPEKPVHLSIVGTGNKERYLKNLVDHLNLTKNVTFMGAIKHEELPEIYRRHDIFILASINEALGNVTQEAIASGLALLTTETGASELLDNNGFILQTGNSKDIAAKLAIFIDHPEILIRFKTKSSEIAQEMTWAVCTNAYEKIYNEIV